MASIRQKTTKDGRKYYEIRVSRGRGNAPLSKNWYAPDGWCQKSIDRELAKVAAEFERQCKAGEILSRRERKEQDLQQRREAARVQTVRQYGETVFMPSKAITMSENGRATYQGNLNRWIYPALGELRLPDVTPANISALLLSMQAQEKAQSTCVKVYTILLSLFKMAYMNDAVPRNPMDKVERPRARKDELQEKGVEAYTVEQVRQIFDALAGEPLKWRAYIHLLIDTGIRRGEACGLRWEAVDFPGNTITISGNLCYTPQKGVYLDTPKSGHARTIDVDPDVMELLGQLRDEQPGSQWVFTQASGSDPMHPQSPTRYMSKFSARYNIPGLHPHLLRHSFASIAITNGADIASVSQKLGHADKATTLKMYTHADAESMKRASQIFRDAIKRSEK